MTINFKKHGGQRKAEECADARVETAQVKHHGPVSFDAFACTQVTENSDVSRICYDKADGYMIICLKSTYHHYFSADAGTVQALQSDSSSSRALMARAATGPSIAGPIPPHPEQVHALDAERLC
ncbi:KTSC domain-containing protein [Acidovorax sp. NPDC077693]|uniref:KTSC domain-containing protein n=1 Tax=unclassified Acidovorax TaxID=2684926 RepID=UPI0037C78241